MSQVDYNQEDYDEENKDMKILENYCSQLSEHFDTVQIFCTRRSENGTINAHYGEGNWFARYGHVKCWLIREEETFRKVAHEE